MSSDSAHTICRKGDLSRLKSLIEEGFDVSSTNYYGDTIISAACLHGHVHIVQFFIEKGLLDIQKPIYRNKTAIHIAINAAHVELIQYFHEVCHADFENIDPPISEEYFWITSPKVLYMTRYLFEVVRIPPTPKFKILDIHGNMYSIPYLLSIARVPISLKDVEMFKKKYKVEFSAGGYATAYFKNDAVYYKIFDILQKDYLNTCTVYTLRTMKMQENLVSIHIVRNLPFHLLTGL